VKLLGLGNTHAAEQLFKQAIAKNPRDPVAHFDLGVVYQGGGDRRGAAREYKLALLDNPRYVPALYNEAVLVAARNPSLAIFYYRQVIRMQLRSPTAFLNVSILEGADKGLHAQAVRDLRQAVRLDPTLRGRVPASLRADVLAGQGGHGRPSHG
jgi:tetratricopeptide (TPR) repeat protein